MGYNTSHQLDDVHSNLVENHLHMLRIALLQFSLQVSTAVLIFAEAVQLTLIMLKRKICKSG